MQIIEEPVRNTMGDYKSDLRIQFISDSVQILREEEAFSFGSLVADCGGALGLFVGFNFLMAWEWMLSCFIRLSSRISCFLTVNQST